MALSPSAAANRRFGFQIKPEITPPPIPTNPGTAPRFRNLIVSATAIPGLSRLTFGRDITDKLVLPQYQWRQSSR
jgi:hypothetical protein